MKTKSDKVKNKRYKLVPQTHPALWKEAEEVKAGDDLSFIAGMEKILRTHPSAVGIAAPQIGISKRVIIVAPNIGKNRRQASIIVAANPIVTSHSEEEDDGKEGCLSFPGVTATVRRCRRITVRYQSVYKLGEETHGSYFGWYARVWLHEIDHVDGICMVGEEWLKTQMPGTLNRIRNGN